MLETYPSKWIDFRSDTVTQPTEEMREAMHYARVGDDVYDDDPTAKELEKLATTMLGKEAALFVPSGTFGNQLCLLTHTRRGQEVIIADSNHIVQHEVGASAVIAGVQLRMLAAENGVVDLAEVKRKIRGADIHYPETGLICTENAHSCGKVISLEQMHALYRLAHDHNIPVHLDGARIFNAAIALNAKAKELAAAADSVMFCLSKGLCAPVGSMIVGQRDFIARARKNCKLMGGGMRQVGFLAAAGIVALQKMVDRLATDHARAKVLAAGLQEIPGITVDRQRLDINMVYFRIECDQFPMATPEELLKHLKQQGILVNPSEEGMYRLVTHYWISDANIETLCQAMRQKLV